MNFGAKISPIGIAAAVGMVALGLAIPVAAQSDSLSMLAGLTKGEWTIKHRDGSADRKICVKTGEELIQLRHEALDCNRYVKEGGQSKVVVQYACPGNGYGLTKIRKESSDLVQIETNGISSGAQYEFAAEARLTGSC